MIIMLARTSKRVPLNETGPSCALQGGNSPEIIQETLAVITKAVRQLHSNDPYEQKIGKALLENWRDEVKKLQIGLFQLKNGMQHL